MNEDDIKLLEDNNITVVCESPFEIETDGESIATGILAHMILEYLKE